MSNIYVHQATGVQIDTTFWRQDVWNTQEQYLQLNDYPQCLNDLRDRLERQLRAFLQDTAVENQLRAYLYHQMSANNYMNADWGSLVASTAQLLEAEIYGQGQAATENLVSNVIQRAIQGFIVRAVERDQQLANTLTQQQINTFGQLVNARNNDIAIVEHYAAQKYGVVQQPAGMPNTRTDFLRQQVSQALPVHAPMARAPASAAVSLSSSFHDVLERAAQIDAPAAQQRTPVNQAPRQQQASGSVFSSVRNLNQAINPQASDNRQVIEEVHLSPHHGYVHQRGGEDVRFEDFMIPSDNELPATTSVNADIHRNRRGVPFPVIDVEGYIMPLVYSPYRCGVNEETGALVKYEDHELNVSNIAPEKGLPVIPVYTHPEDQREDEPVQQTWLAEDKREVLPEPVVGMERDTAFAFVGFRENAWHTKNIHEFVRMNVDTVMLADPKEIHDRFAGLFMTTPETDLSELWRRVQQLPSYSMALYKKINRRATQAVNEILGKRLGLSITIDSYSEDWSDLMAALQTKGGDALVRRFAGMVHLAHSSICCLAGEAVHRSLLKHNACYNALSKQVGLVWDGDRSSYVLPSEAMRDANQRYRTEIESELGLVDGIVMLVDQEYCCLLPVEFDCLGLAISDGPTVVYPSSTPELNKLLHGVVERAGGFDSLFRRIVIGTIDGVMIQVHPTPGEDTEGKPLYSVEIIEE